MPAIARAMRARTRVRRTAAGTTVTVACACRVVSLPVTAGDVLEDVLAEATATHAAEAPACPHRRRDEDDER